MEPRLKSFSSEIKLLLTRYKRVPVWKKLSSKLSPWDIYLRTPDHPHRFLLESGKMGRYSYIGGKPRGILRLKGGDSLTELRDWLQERRSPSREEWGKLSFPPFGQVESVSLPPVMSGAFGFFSYDWVRSIERLPEWAADDLATPDVYLLEPVWLMVKDHVTDDLYLVFNLASVEELETVQQTFDEMEAWLNDENHPAVPRMGWDRDPRGSEPMAKGPGDDTGSFANRSFSMDKREFLMAVETVKEYIRAGDVFQVNLSLRESRPVRVSGQQIYDQLRRINPSPYMGLLEFPDITLVSSSPELLVRLREGLAETRPIAGTRKRTGDREHDLRMMQELIDNEKERAEHIMLVDLERNDLGRVCRYGSVRVDELMGIEEYSHVMHIVSHISGKLRDEMDGVDLLAAVFPGGTITGAPKIRTMEIIEELEPMRRGVYTGSIGWLSFAGDMEVNIAIRTMVVKDGMAHVQAGAGVVIDSVAEREYKESLRKAEALWLAFEQAHVGVEA
jgi:para-aminobenzoate synthetase component 1